MERILAAGSERRASGTQHSAFSNQQSAFQHAAISSQHSAWEGLDPISRAAAPECSPGCKPWVPKREMSSPTGEKESARTDSEGRRLNADSYGQQREAASRSCPASPPPSAPPRKRRTCKTSPHALPASPALSLLP